MLGKGNAAPDLMNMPPGLLAGREGTGAHAGTCGDSCPEKHSRRSASKGSSIMAYLAPDCQYSRSWLIEGTAGLFGLTQFQQATHSMENRF